MLCEGLFSLSAVCVFPHPQQMPLQLLTLSAVLQTLPALTDKQGWRDGSAVKAALEEDPSIATYHSRGS